LCSTPVGSKSENWPNKAFFTSFTLLDRAHSFDPSRGFEVVVLPRVDGDEDLSGDAWEVLKVGRRLTEVREVGGLRASDTDPEEAGDGLPWPEAVR